jgi:signal transduction histidine kinase
VTLLRETDDQDLESVVYIERVQQTYLHALGNRPRTVLAQILVGGVFWFSEINTGAFLIWIGFAVVTNGMLWVLEVQFRSVVLDFDSAHRWALYRVIFSGIASIPFGIAIFLLPPSAGAIPELMLFVILSAIVTVSSTGFSTLPGVYQAVNALTLGLLTVGFLAKGDSLHFGFAIVSIVWQYAVLRKAAQVSKTSIEGIRTNEKLRREVAQHKATKAQLTDLNRQKDQAFTIIGHDLLGPFTILQTYSQMLKTSADSFSREKIAELSDNLIQATDGALQLVQNLLDWSRAQMHRVEVAAEPLPIDELVAQSIQELEFVAREKEISLSYQASDLVALADQALCKTVMRNLISNAIKFTLEQGTIKITSRQEGEFVTIQVSDDGVGMDRDQIDGLFELGENKTTAGTRGEQSTGLGLVVCKEFVDVQDGKLSVESTPGKGSAVSVALPKYEG